MISKTNSSPSFGMALRQEKMGEILEGLSEKGLKAYQKGANMLHNYSEKRNSDVFITGIVNRIEPDEEAAAAGEVARDVVDRFTVKIMGKGEDSAERVLNFDLNELPTKSFGLRKWFRSFKKDIRELQILSDIKSKFGL